MSPPVITPKGRERLAQLKTPIIASSQPRPVLAAETIEPVTSKERGKQQSPESSLLAKVEQEAEAIKPLMDEHDSLNEDIAAYDEFLDDNQRQSQEVADERQKINSQIEELTKEMNRITRLLEDANKQRAELTMRETKLGQEMESYVQEKQTAVERVADLKEQIRTILYKYSTQNGGEKSDLGA